MVFRTGHFATVSHVIKLITHYYLTLLDIIAFTVTNPSVPLGVFGWFTDFSLSCRMLIIS